MDTIKIDGITVSYVSKKYPRKLIQHLRTVRGYEIVQYAKGIWHIKGGIFPMQLIVTSRLTAEENFWLKNLTNDLKRKEEAENLFTEYGKHKDSNLHKSVMDLIMRANQKVFKEARGSMCDALMELMQDVIQEKVEDGKLEGAQEKLFELIQKKVAKGKSVEQIADELEESVETVKVLIERLGNK